MRPLLAARLEAQQAVREARDSLLRLVPDPDDAMLAGGGGPQAFVRAEAAEKDAASLQHLADAEAGLPGQVAGLRSAQQAVAAAAGQLRGLETARADLPGQIAAAEDRLAEARLLAAGLGAAARAAGCAEPPGRRRRAPGRPGAAARGQERGPARRRGHAPGR